MLLAAYLIAGATLAGLCFYFDRGAFVTRKGRRFEAAMFAMAIALAWPPLVALFAQEQLRDRVAKFRRGSPR